MERILLMECAACQKRLAVLEDGKLAEYMVERESQKRLVGNIYLGRVLNVLPGMQAAFVDIGLEKNAFLSVGDILLPKGDMDPELLRPARPIEKMLRPGQQIMVQVVKEPGGDKGPRVTTHITLPGRCLVLLPTVTYLGVSRKITDEARRAELRQTASGLSQSNVGWIVRTEGEQADTSAFEADAAYLLTLWEKLAQRASHDVAPKLLYSDADLAQRIARDLMGANTARCLVQGEADYQRVRAAVLAFAPEKLPCVESYEGDTPLLEAWDVERKVDKALARRVWLKSGGYLVIEPAEALTTIDVNTGKFVGKRSLSDTVFKTNCEAAVEIARQLRLRDLGGILLIDFIDMETDAQREEVLRLLEENARWDRGKIRIAGFTQQGLLELTRKKVHAPLHTLVQCPCPYCQGEGWILSPESVAHQILRELRGKEGAWVIRCHPEVAEALKALGLPEAPACTVCAEGHRHIEKADLEPADPARKKGGKQNPDEESSDGKA